MISRYIRAKLRLKTGVDYNAGNDYALLKGNRIKPCIKEPLNNLGEIL